MLNLKSIYDEVAVNESKKSKHIFENGDITFADIRDCMTSVFNGNGILISDNVPKINVLITYKNGDFCICTDINELNKPKNYSKFSDRCCKSTAEVKSAFRTSLKNLIDALNELDPILLNKYFANGLNFMECSMVYPPEECCSDYCNKCFISPAKIKCFDKNFKEVGCDDESTESLLAALSEKPNLSYELSQMSKQNMLKMKHLHSGKKALEDITAQLSLLIDGVGWRCSLNNYIKDKYSSHIVNKALQHGLDVSKNSPFVSELTSRLSDISAKPTKSDLVTFAKRDGINCKSDLYKEFLADIEQSAEEISAKVIKPIENLIYKAIMIAANNILGYMSCDPSLKAQKLLDGIDETCFEFNESEGVDFSADKLDVLKKNIMKIDLYSEIMPKNIIIMYNKKPYSMTSTFKKINDLYNIAHLR